MNYICKCKKINFLKNEYTYWEDRKVTTDELDIINFLKKSKNINPPGDHGAEMAKKKKRNKLSQYSLGLLEKQKLRFFWNPQ